MDVFLQLPLLLYKVKINLIVCPTHNNISPCELFDHQIPLRKVLKQHLERTQPYLIITVTLENEIHQKEVKWHFFIENEISGILAFVVHGLGEVFGKGEVPFCQFFRVVSNGLVDIDVGELEVSVQLEVAEELLKGFIKIPIIKSSNILIEIFFLELPKHL